MQQPVQSSRILFYLEWIVLGIATLTVLLTASVRASPTFSLLAVLTIVVFAAMGFKLPTKPLRYQVLYTCLEFGLILLPSLIDDRIPMVPMLGIVAAIRSSRMFGLSGRLIVASLAGVLFTVPLFRYQSGLQSSASQTRFSLDQISCSLPLLRLLSVASLGLVVVFIVLLASALVIDRQNREKLALAHEQLRHYALRIEDQAALQERNRIAREIHDALGHTLTAQSIQLENALLFLQSNTDKAETFLVEAQRLSSKALRDVRQSITALWTDPLQGQSLQTAIALIVHDLCDSTSIIPDCKISLPQPLPQEMRTALYRIVQEALTNICKHSAATHITVHLHGVAGMVRLQITDNGKGFNPEQNTSGFGLQGMRERAAALGGQLRVISRPGTGCQISASIPLRPQID